MDYKALVDESLALAEAGQGKLLRRLQELESQKQSLLGRSEFYMAAISYLAHRAHRHGVQVVFQHEWEYFLCTKVLHACNVGAELTGNHAHAQSGIEAHDEPAPPAPQYLDP